jgi:peptide-methionine (R)-S-oxide reductase
MSDTDLPGRRRVLAQLVASVIALPILSACGSGEAQAKAFPIQRSEAEWRKLLTPEQFFILRGMARSGPSPRPLDKEKRKGTFVCAADGNAAVLLGHQV